MCKVITKLEIHVLVKIEIFGEGGGGVSSNHDNTVYILVLILMFTCFLHSCMCVFIGAQSNPAADARKDEEIRFLQDQLEKMRLDNANKDSAIEKLVSNEIKCLKLGSKIFQI